MFNLYPLGSSKPSKYLYDSSCSWQPQIQLLGEPKKIFWNRKELVAANAWATHVITRLWFSQPITIKPKWKAAILQSIPNLVLLKFWIEVSSKAMVFSKSRGIENPFKHRHTYWGTNNNLCSFLKRLGLLPHAPSSIHCHWSKIISLPKPLTFCVDLKSH